MRYMSDKASRIDVNELGSILVTLLYSLESSDKHTIG